MNHFASQTVNENQRCVNASAKLIHEAFLCYFVCLCFGFHLS